MAKPKFFFSTRLPLSRKIYGHYSAEGKKIGVVAFSEVFLQLGSHSALNLVNIECDEVVQTLNF